MTDTAAGDNAGAQRVQKGERPVNKNLRVFFRNKAAVTGVGILAVFILAAIFAPLLTPYDPTHQVLSQSFQTPSLVHPLGTDDLGRDILARIMYGGRYTLMIGVVATLLAVAIGVPLGLISGYFGSWFDMGIQRVADIMLSFNAFLLALVLVAVMGVGMKSVIIAAGIGVIPQFIRLARGQALSLRESVYVEAAEAFGSMRMTILRRHLLRNSLTPIVVFATLNVGLTILVAAGLGFLGLGVQPPLPEWGTMLGEGRSYIFHASYTSTFPGLAIFLVVLGFNLAGDGLRDALDPNLRE
ncbi:ABC transporter permease [Spelaeicoccus albus]|uniref:Peptide/nickel transport system permease protein n=1 Tax=Spelaeicoccus albus TaxID=1280376 RepID=A0A7Z0ABR9_9MICO|nr:ABC transporter permease [Spelaeicoccus albus]NYI67278.1 peptide/nickel transport system permease protein [Spelaeicoccus albus]